MSKNDENIIAFCNELRAYVEEHHLFPDKHCRMSHKISTLARRSRQEHLRSGNVRCLKKLKNLVISPSIQEDVNVKIIQKSSS